MRPSESHHATETKLARITWLSERDPTKVFSCLMHHFNEGSLKRCYQELEGGKATGIDKVNKAQYGERLDDNVRKLVTRMEQMAYRPGAVRKVLIPKDGKPKATRALGICNFEDKLVYKMMQKVLESIYEPLFLAESFGFRPNRGCHDAIKALKAYLDHNPVETCIDVDLENFFGTIDHKVLLEILGKKIKDKRFMRYITRSLKAGTLTEGDMQVSDEGVVQGSAHSPVLSNIVAHEVIDTWFKEVVKPHCRGQVELFRYADDLVICCQYEYDAKRIKKALGERLQKYHLKMNEEKTKLIKFSRWQFNQGKKQGTFDYLGFTFYWGRSRKGFPILMLSTSAKKMRVKLKRVTIWAREMRNQMKLKVLWKAFCIKLAGHVRYYGVSHNWPKVKAFLDKAVFIFFKWVNRRSQRKSFTWEKFELFMQLNPPPQAKIHHKLF